jgi:hypothetical protein
MCKIFGFTYITVRPVHWISRIPKSFLFYEKLPATAWTRRLISSPAASYYKNNVTDETNHLHPMHRAAQTQTSLYTTF